MPAPRTTMGWPSLFVISGKKYERERESKKDAEIVGPLMMPALKSDTLRPADGKDLGVGTKGGRPGYNIRAEGPWDIDAWWGWVA